MVVQGFSKRAVNCKRMFSFLPPLLLLLNMSGPMFTWEHFFSDRERGAENTLVLRTEIMSKQTVLVEGEILLEGARSFSGATAYVRIEDVGRADAASQVFAEQVMRNVSYTPGRDTQLKISLQGEAPNPQTSYSVSVHIDVDGDGQISRGDYISTQSYPVLTFGAPNRVSVQVQEVK